MTPTLQFRRDTRKETDGSGGGGAKCSKSRRLRVCLHIVLRYLPPNSFYVFIPRTQTPPISWSHPCRRSAFLPHRLMDESLDCHTPMQTKQMTIKYQANLKKRARLSKLIEVTLHRTSVYMVISEESRHSYLIPSV